MARVDSGTVVRDLGRLFEGGTLGALTDRQLMERFLQKRGEDAELAFALLVRRHGPMVLGVCRRFLTDPHAVDDAFQATFLVLVRRAGAVHVHDSLGRWLYGVSRRVAARARAQAERRRRSENSVTAGAKAFSIQDEPSGDQCAVLDEELGRLPEKYRLPVVLCHLEGLTQEQASRALGWPLGTVQGRLARARLLLKDRLTRRGLAPAAALLEIGRETRTARAAVSETLVRATVDRAAHAAARHVATASVAALADGISTTFIMARVKAATLLLVLGVLGAGAGISAGSGRQECGADGGSPAEDQRTAVAIHPDSALEPKLKMSLLYPKVRSTDQVASYAITIENIGTATARNVETAAVVPIGGRLIDQPTRGVRPRYDPSSRILRWPSTQLEPGEKSKLTYPFQVRMGSPGVYQVQVQVCAEGLPLQTRVGQTKVQGIADLEMTIDQSRRVLDVNDTGTFTIRIKNIGSGDARRLALSGRHTDNIKVTETAGTEAQAAYSPKDPTAFVFPLIQRLGKGQSIELGIRVQALKAGTATFRVNLMHDGADDTLEELAQIRITPAR